MHIKVPMENHCLYKFLKTCCDIKRKYIPIISVYSINKAQLYKYVIQSLQIRNINPHEIYNSVLE